MRRNDRLQRLLYLIMAALLAYIVVKSGNIVLRKKNAAGGSSSAQQMLEDAAISTWAPGYTASVRNQKSSSWLADWMRQAVPVFSYLADEAAEGETEAEETVEAEESAETKESAEAEETAEAKESAEAKETVEAEETAEAEESAETKESAEAEETAEAKESAEAEDTVQETLQEVLAQAADFNWLTSNFYTIDSETRADASLLNGETLLSEDLSLEQNPEVPQILIYHTHSQEAFADSREGNTEDSIVGMGEVLADGLRAYGYQVIHNTDVYDLVDGVLDRSAAYDYAREAVEAILKEYPTIEVVIDLHRDGVDGQKFVTEVDGKDTAMIMFFNGISRDSQGNPISSLENPYLVQNLAFSLQLEVLARSQYPGFTRNIYLKGERFNLHLRARSLLIEAGTQENTVEEERNAMGPLADLLQQLLGA